MTDKITKCSCGSGKPCKELYDARGIYCCKVCENCEASKRASYRPEIFTNANYWAAESIDAED